MAILANSTTATADILIPVMLNLAATAATTNNLVVTTTITAGVGMPKVAATLNPETVDTETTTVMVVAAVLMAGNSLSLANPLKL